MYKSLSEVESEPVGTSTVNCTQPTGKYSKNPTGNCKTVPACRNMMDKIISTEEKMIDSD
jgi:hypothetical protein